MYSFAMSYFFIIFMNSIFITQCLHKSSMAVPYVVNMHSMTVSRETGISERIALW